MTGRTRYHASAPGRRLALACLAVTAGSLAVGSAAVGQSGNTYQNPILNEQLADPSVFNDNGQLYVYGTGKATDGGYIPMSKLADPTDFNSWTSSKGSLKLPQWSDGGAWAPHVVRNPDKGAAADYKYLMFLSVQGSQDENGTPTNTVVVDGKSYHIKGACMIVAHASAPDATFVAQEEPLDLGICNTTPKPDSSGKIDPFFYVDDGPKGDGTMWLYWGSSHSPLSREKVVINGNRISLTGAQQTLNNIDYDTKKVVPMKGTDPDDGNVQYTDLLEGSWLFYRAPYYYLMTSGYSCCNPTSDPKGYAVVVWRTGSIKDNAAWERMPESLGTDGTVLRSSNRTDAAWESPGHNSLFLDGKGKWWIVYHARHPTDPMTGKTHPDRLLMMDMLKWDNNWPSLVTDGSPDTPSEGSMPAPALPLPNN